MAAARRQMRFSGSAVKKRMGTSKVSDSGMRSFSLRRMRPAGVTDYGAAIRRSHFHQTAIIGIFPDRKPWARCSPLLHGFPVGAFLAPHPLQQIDDQVFNGVVHWGYGLVCESRAYLGLYIGIFPCASATLKRRTVRLSISTARKRALRISSLPMATAPIARAPMANAPRANAPTATAGTLAGGSCSGSRSKTA